MHVRQIITGSSKNGSRRGWATDSTRDWTRGSKRGWATGSKMGWARGSRRGWARLGQGLGQGARTGAGNELGQGWKKARPGQELNEGLDQAQRGVGIVLGQWHTRELQITWDRGCDGARTRQRLGRGARAGLRVVWDGAGKRVWQHGEHGKYEKYGNMLMRRTHRRLLVVRKFGA